MNGVVPAGQPATVEVSYSDPSLFVGVQLYDDSGGSPSPVGSVVHMLNFAGVSYRAKLTGAAGKWYLYRIAAYTDNTYTTVDTEQPQGSGTLFFESGSDLGGRILTGYLTVTPRIGDCK